MTPEKAEKADTDDIEVPDDVSQDDVAEANEDADKSQEALDEAEEDFDKAQEAAIEAQAAAEDASAAAVQASSELDQANEAYEQVSEQSGDVIADATGVSGALPGGASEEDLAAAEKRHWPRSPAQFLPRSEYPAAPPDALRWLLRVAQPPSLMCSIVRAGGRKMTCTCPPMRSVRAGAAPRYGTWIMFTPAIILNSSPATWGRVPMPGEAMLSLPLFALAWAMNPDSVVAGTDGCVTMTNGSRLTPATGAISRRKL